MNIFYLDDNPVTAARLLADQHVNKMLVEATQMLVNCVPEYQLHTGPLTRKGTTRKYSYYNHPCSQWTRYNNTWVLEYAYELAKTYRLLHNKKQFSEEVLDWIRVVIKPTYNESIDPAAAMPNFYLVYQKYLQPPRLLVKESYHKYYVLNKIPKLQRVYGRVSWYYGKPESFNIGDCRE